MLDWLGRKLLYIAAAFGLLWYFLSRERKAAKTEARADELQRVHDNVKKAKETADGVAGLDADAQRQQLRDRWSK